MDETRVDRWLWAIRLCKSRTDATDACRAGRVKVNGRAAKAATTVRAGDRVEARLHGRDRVLAVVQVLDKRVGAPLAVQAYVDHSPPAPDRDADLVGGIVRDRGTGRPTKRDRRQLDRLRGD